MNIRTKEKIQTIYVIIMETSWLIWKTINAFIFNAARLSVSKVVDSIVISAYAWMKFRARKEDIVWQN